MSGLINFLLSDKIIRLGSIASIGFLVLSLIYIGFSYFSLPPYIPLYNQMPWGVERLGLKYQIFIPPLISLTIIFMNNVIGYFLYSNMPLVSRMLSITSLLYSIITMIYIVRTIILV